ncbi:MAG: agmatinase [Candidatus Rokubacteria bacterium]|nr:agmatinase [Candidatus Rokubacteria bacterium]
MTHPFQPIDAFKSPRFAQIATFMRLPHHRIPADLDVALVGIPFDGGTSYRAGARFGPREIRVQSAMIRPWNPVLRVSPFEALRIADYGDIDISPVSIERTNEIVEHEITAILAAGCVPVSVGGDHSIALPILRALAKRHGPVALVHFDSHPDTWDQYFGSRYFHGTMFRRAVEEHLIDPRRTFQIAIRGPLYSADDFDFQAQHGLSVLRVEALKEHGVGWAVEQYARLKAAKVYVSFDIDAVDPAFAPGTGTPEVGGLTSYEALALVRGLRGLDIVGFDLVEVAPQYDSPGQITALLAANLLFEFLSLLASTR